MPAWPYYISPWHVIQLIGFGEAARGRTIMTSVRLDDQLEIRLREVARLTGQPVSRIIRDAISDRCDLLLGERLDLRLADVIGIIASDGNRADRTGDAFRELLARERTATT
jgi:predicted DNA-binding protein